MTIKERETILVVDDIPENIATLVSILRDHYRVIFATNGKDALTLAQTQPQPHLILLDVMMPEMDGYEVCRRLKADIRTLSIPIIFLTAHDDARNEAEGLKLGSVDYLHKPCHPAIVLQRVKIHLALHNQHIMLETRVQERTRELEDTQLEIIRRLGRAGEYRDNETGTHVIRMSLFCYQLALATNVSKAQAELLKLAAPMHDIGKIGIPDNILLKPGKLTEDERTLMQRHTLIGAEIIGDHASDLLSLAKNIALTHHERWDGKGYPHGLSEDEIPFEGRIAAICDVFDALTSERPYKKAWSFDDAIQYIISESGKAFDPELTSVFVDLLPECILIRQCYKDPFS